MFRGFVTFRGLHLIHAAHAVGFHRGDGLAKQDKIEAGEGLDGGMVGDVAVYLLSGLGAQHVIVVQVVGIPDKVFGGTSEALACGQATSKNLADG